MSAARLHRAMLAGALLLGAAWVVSAQVIHVDDSARGTGMGKAGTQRISTSRTRWPMPRDIRRSRKSGWPAARTAGRKRGQP